MIQMFRKKTKIEKIHLVTGTILMEGTEHNQIYKVLQTAKNVNYNSLKKTIEPGDLVVCSEWMHNHSFKLDNKTYYIIKPSQIKAYFE